ncbi:hypothetical protein Q8A72_09765 [Aeribacillus pallidus]|nr:hypothetical protein [Aeribacillus pallidus]
MIHIKGKHTDAVIYIKQAVVIDGHTFTSPPKILHTFSTKRTKFLLGNEFFKQKQRANL